MKKRVNPLMGILIIVLAAIIMGMLLVYGAANQRADADIDRTIAYGAAGSPNSPRNAPPPGVDTNAPLPNMPEVSHPAP